MNLSWRWSVRFRAQRVILRLAAEHKGSPRWARTASYQHSGIHHEPGAGLIHSRGSVGAKTPLGTVTPPSGGSTPDGPCRTQSVWCLLQGCILGPSSWLLFRWHFFKCMHYPAHSLSCTSLLSFLQEINYAYKFKACIIIKELIPLLPPHVFAECPVCSWKFAWISLVWLPWPCTMLSIP